MQYPVHAPTTLNCVPHRFCWTKFGIESGEAVETILARKESEREANGGMFLWGIGNSVAPGIRALVQLETSPIAVFSPMRAKPKSIDSAPTGVVVWRKARTVEGTEWRIPAGSTVVSRAESGKGIRKRSHYALVCRSDAPLRDTWSSLEVRFGKLSNLMSGAPLGFSQVTSVVAHKSDGAEIGPRYPVGFFAYLAYPYFVELFDPAPFASLWPAGNTGSSEVFNWALSL